MAKAPLEVVVRHIRKIVDVQTLAEATDEQLVERFARGHEEVAFATLLRRHGPMVLGVSQGILRQLEDAEDVFQATFLLLARKAGSIRKRESVASWLHGVAYRLAIRAKAQRALRRSQEMKASSMRKPGPNVEEAWRELRPVLDEEMEKLPEKYRTALVLYYLEGKTQEEVARELGCPVGTVQSRLGRGRKLLQERLTRRGLALSAGSFTAFLVAGTASATIRAQFLDSTLKACLQFATAKSAAALVSAPVAALVEAGLKAILSTKLKIATALLLAVSFVAGAGALTHQVFEAKPAEIKQDAVLQPATQRSERGFQEQARTDQYGDPLPPSALARLGTVRLRHGQWVSSVVFSRDGKVLASGSYDNTVRLWEPLTGKELQRFPMPETGQVWSIALSPDGKTMCAGGSDHFLHLYSLSTREKIRPFGFANGLGGFNAVAFSPDGKTIAGGSIRREVGIWDVRTGEVRHQIQGHQDRVTSVSFSPDGKILASGSLDRTIRIWETGTGKELQRFVGHEDQVNSVAFSPDGQFVASGGDDRTARLWELSTGKEVRRIQELRGSVRAVAFSPSGTTMATGIRLRVRDLNQACDIQLWEVTTGKELCRFSGPQSSVHALAFSPDGRFLASGSVYSVVRFWDVASTRELGPPRAPQFSVSAAALSPDGSTVASGSFQTIHLWQAATGKELGRLPGHQGMVRCLAFSPDGKTLVSGGEDNPIRLWDVATGKQLRQLEGHRYPVAAVAFSPDGRTITSSSGDRSIRFWDRTTGQELRQFQVPEAEGHAAAFSPDGKTFAVLSPGASRLSLWEVTEGKEFHQLGRHEEGVRSLAFSPDGRVLASGSVDGGVHLLETTTGRELCQLGEASSRAVDSLCFSPDGKSLASGARDGTIRIWEVITGKERFQLKGHQGGVGSIAFSANGQRMVSGSEDTTVLVWDMTGRVRDEQVRRVRLSSEEQEAAWACLAGEDASAANLAIWRLMAADDQTVQFVKECMRPVAVVDKQRLTRLVAQLDSEHFAVRQSAWRQLEELGEIAGPILRETLAGKPSAEVRRRGEELLRKLDAPLTSGRLRDLRAVELLEHIGTLEAEQVLQSLAKGAPEARLTQEAKASLGRLSKRP